LTNEKGRKTAVVLPIEDYEKLSEDLDDLAVIAERREEETIPNGSYLNGLRARTPRALKWSTSTVATVKSSKSATAA
jgi:hypothetical protein